MNTKNMEAFANRILKSTNLVDQRLLNLYRVQKAKQNGIRIKLDGID